MAKQHASRVSTEQNDVNKSALVQSNSSSAVKTQPNIRNNENDRISGLNYQSNKDSAFDIQTTINSQPNIVNGSI